MPRDPGQYNRRISLLTVTRTPDGGGGYTESVDVTARLWAKVEPITGTEQVEAMQTGIQRPHRFTVPYRAGLGAVTNALYAGRTFDIKNVVDPDAAHYELVLIADEIFP